MLLLDTPYLSNMIIWLSSAFNNKVCVMPLRAIFHSTVFPLIFTSSLGTDIIFVCLSPFMHPWILSKFISVSYLSMCYLSRVYLPPNSHPSCKCVMMRSQARAFPFILSCRIFPCLFLSISTKAARMQQSKHQVTYKSLMDELFCLTGLLQGAGEAADKKLTWESQRCPICQE